jgi:hypothetical protein
VLAPIITCGSVMTLSAHRWLNDRLWLIIASTASWGIVDGETWTPRRSTTSMAPTTHCSPSRWRDSLPAPAVVGAAHRVDELLTQQVGDVFGSSAAHDIAWNEPVM